MEFFVIIHKLALVTKRSFYNVGYGAEPFAARWDRKMLKLNLVILELVLDILVVLLLTLLILVFRLLLLLLLLRLAPLASHAVTYE